MANQIILALVILLPSSKSTILCFLTKSQCGNNLFSILIASDSKTISLFSCLFPWGTFLYGTFGILIRISKISFSINFKSLVVFFISSLISEFCFLRFSIFEFSPSFIFIPISFDDWLYWLFKLSYRLLIFFLWPV